MTTVTIASPLLQAIHHHAQACYPEECCGLLIGQKQDNQWLIQEIIPTENCWGEDGIDLGELDLQPSQNLSKHNRFAIDPRVLFQVQKQYQGQETGMVGVYHSHPQGRPHPSSYDRAIAWSGYLYWIVAVDGQGKTEGRGWCLDGDGEFQPVLREGSRG